MERLVSEREQLIANIVATLPGLSDAALRGLLRAASRELPNPQRGLPPLRIVDVRRGSTPARFQFPKS